MVTPEQESIGKDSTSAPSTQNGASNSVFSIRQGESSATSAPETSNTVRILTTDRKKRKPKKRVLPSKDLGTPPIRPGERYWNEFDDGSDVESNEPFTIFIDPNDSDIFPGVANLSRKMRSLIEKVQSIRTKAFAWFTSPSPEKEATLDERRRLIEEEIGRTEIEDSSDSDNERETFADRHYSTIPKFHPTDSHLPSKVLLLRGCIGCFAASYLLLVIAALLLTTGRQKAAAEVDTGVIIGVAASLVFAILAVGCMLSRRERGAWIPHLTAALLLLLVTLANALLLWGLSHRQE